MRFADHPKKLGLLLLPLIPLSAIGIVEVVDTVVGRDDTCACTTAPIEEAVRVEPAPPPPVRTERPTPTPPA